MTRKLVLFVVMAVVIGVGQAALAVEYKWNQLAAGNYNWAAAANWLPNTGYPDAVGDVANLQVDITGNVQIAVPGEGGVTVGTLSLSDNAGNGYYYIGTDIHSGVIHMDSGGGGGGAVINRARALVGFSHDAILADIVLHEDLTINDTFWNTSKFLRIYGAISEVGGSRSVTKTGAGNAMLADNNTYTGLTRVQQGRLHMGNQSFTPSLNPAPPTVPPANLNTTVPGDLTVDAGASLQSHSSDVISDTSLVTMNGTWTPSGGGTQVETIGALAGTTTGGIGPTYTLIIAGSQNAVYNGILNVQNSGGYFEKRGNSTQEFGGTATNGIGDCRVTGGVLVLNKTGGAKALGSTTAPVRKLTIGDGASAGSGEVRLGADNQIREDYKLVLRGGGTFNANGYDEDMGPIGIQSDSFFDVFLDLGAGTGALLKFADSSAETWTPGVTLNLLHWSGNLDGGGTEQLMVGTANDNLTGGQLAQIVFVDPAGLPPGNYGAHFSDVNPGEIIPSVPEPATLTLIALGGLVALLRRRR